MDAATGRATGSKRIGRLVAGEVELEEAGEELVVREVEGHAVGGEDGAVEGVVGLARRDLARTAAAGGHALDAEIRNQ